MLINVQDCQPFTFCSIIAKEITCQNANLIQSVIFTQAASAYFSSPDIYAPVASVYTSSGYTYTIHTSQLAYTP